MKQTIRQILMENAVISSMVDRSRIMIGRYYVKAILNQSSDVSLGLDRQHLESLIEKICPIGKEIKKLLNDKKYLISILNNGTEKADSISSIKLKKIHEKIGFLS